MENPFVDHVDNYKRNLNPLKHYAQQQAYYLSVTTGDRYDDCLNFVRTSLRPGGIFEYKDVKMDYLQRDETGDRHLVESTVREFLTEVIKNEEILAPTFTTYIPTKKKRSYLGVEIGENIKARNVAKKAMFAAEAAEDKFGYQFYHSEQTNRKLSNNAVSGAHVTPSTPLYNKTAHSTLTSICRSTSGYGNANNERLLTGNRHYRNWLITKNNIVSIIANTDYDQLDATIKRYGLVYPTAEQASECIKYSTDLYWFNKTRTAEIYELLKKLTPSQRAAVVYTGDFYHLMKFNEEFIRTFLTKLIAKVQLPCEFPLAVIKAAPESYVELAHQICTLEVVGIGKKYALIEEDDRIHTLASTILNIGRVVVEYADLIKTFIRTNNLPPSVAYFPESIRRAAVTSDTDSTIFTVQDWIIWYCGGVDFTPTGISIEAAMTFIASSSITHVLAVMSANIGVDKSKLFDIAMKSEFRFDVFVPTLLGKHYYAAIGCQEGNVYAKHKTEIKGVHLKNSNITKKLTSRAEEMMVEIMQTVMSGKKISLLKYLKEIADIERMVMRGVHEGDSDFLRSGSIKDPESYTKDEEDSPYQHHTFWNTVFGWKYGEMETPPYSTLKVSLNLSSRKKLLAWIEGIEDKTLADKLSVWMSSKEKTNFNTFYIPVDILEARGFPAELVPVIDARRTAQELCKAFYIILETLGFFTMGEGRVQRLVSDYY
jgi:hypothetical protein